MSRAAHHQPSAETENPLIVAGAATANHHVAEVADRRALLLRISSHDDPAQQQRSPDSTVELDSETTPLTIVLSAKGQAKLMEVAQSLSSFTDAVPLARGSHPMLTRLLCEEISKGELHVLRNSSDTRELRRRLSGSFSTNSPNPVPVTLDKQARLDLETLLGIFILHKTPAASLPPKLHFVKPALVVNAVRAAQEERAAKIAKLEKITRELNELLHSNDEISFPLPHPFSDAEATVEAMVASWRQEPWASLPQRKPEVWSAMKKLLISHAGQSAV